MWAEGVDEVNFDSRVFPRVFSIAERLWSDQSVNVIDWITLMRLEHHRCNVVRRGIGAGPLSPGYCEASYGV
jgi:hexosaminidase